MNFNISELEPISFGIKEEIDSCVTNFIAELNKLIDSFLSKHVTVETKDNFNLFISSFYEHGVNINCYKLTEKLTNKEYCLFYIIDNGIIKYKEIP